MLPNRRQIAVTHKDLSQIVDAMVAVHQLIFISGTWNHGAFVKVVDEITEVFLVMGENSVRKVDFLSSIR